MNKTTFAALTDIRLNSIVTQELWSLRSIPLSKLRSEVRIELCHCGSHALPGQSLIHRLAASMTEAR